MRLLSSISRKYKNKEYLKYWIIISSKIIKSLGWKKGDELESKVQDETLIIKKKK